MKKSDFLITNRGIISEEKKQEYLHRLIIPYQKNNEEKVFISQYEQGSGHEISNKKFWAKISSSRLAFEVYSWRAMEKEFTDFEFEKKLPGICHEKGTSGVPNMDVYFETKDEVTFIESKFTETPPSTIELAQAYWQTEDTYLTTKNEPRTFPISKRYRNNSSIAKKLSAFYKRYTNIEIEENEWFDFAQEMKHLFGIVFYVIENKGKILTRKISFYNIVYHFDEYESLGTESKSDLATSFVKEATQLVNEIFISEGLNNKFIYDLQFVQSELEKNGNQKAFGSNDSVRQLIKKNFNIETYP